MIALLAMLFPMRLLSRISLRFCEGFFDERAGKSSVVKLLFAGWDDAARTCENDWSFIKFFFYFVNYG